MLYICLYGVTTRLTVVVPSWNNVQNFPKFLRFCHCGVNAALVGR